MTATSDLAQALLALTPTGRDGLATVANELRHDHRHPTVAAVWSMLHDAAAYVSEVDERRLLVEWSGDEISHAATVTAVALHLARLTEPLANLTDGDRVAIAGPLASLTGELHEAGMEVARLVIEVGYHEAQVVPAPPAPPESGTATEHPPGAGSPGHQRSPVELIDDEPRSDAHG